MKHMLNKTQKVRLRGLILVATIFSFLNVSAIAMLNDEITMTSKPTKQTMHNPKFPSTSMPDSDWWHTLWPHPKNVILELGIKEDGIAIDLCCGDGYFTFPLAEVSSKVYGIELDAELLEKARQEANTRNLTNCVWQQGDAMKISELVQEPVDFVLIANTFHGIPEKSAMAKSIASVLKPNGELAIINWHRKPREETTVLGLPRGPKTEMRMTPEDVDKSLYSSGFVRQSLIELPPYHYGIVFKKLHINLK